MDNIFRSLETTGDQLNVDPEASIFEGGPDREVEEIEHEKLAGADCESLKHDINRHGLYISATICKYASLFTFLDLWQTLLIDQDPTASQ